MSTLLEIVTDGSLGAAVLCGLPNPTSIVGSSDPNAPTLLRLANQVGKELARRHDWQALKVDYTVTSLATEAQTAFPSDFDHIVSNTEIWNRSTNQRYAFPTDDLTWGRVKGLGITGGQPGWARILGNVLYITPAPTAGQTIAFPYQSNAWVQPASGSNKTAFTLDTDTPLIPAELIKLGIVWQYKSQKGFDYAEALSTFEREVERYTSRDKGGPKVIGLSNRHTQDPLQVYSWPGRIN